MKARITDVQRRLCSLTEDEAWLLLEALEWASTAVVEYSGPDDWTRSVDALHLKLTEGGL